MPSSTFSLYLFRCVTLLLLLRPVCGGATLSGGGGGDTVLLLLGNGNECYNPPRPRLVRFAEKSPAGLLSLQTSPGA